MEKTGLFLHAWYVKHGQNITKYVTEQKFLSELDAILFFSVLTQLNATSRVILSRVLTIFLY
jgi:hypothetical protein